MGSVVSIIQGIIFTIVNVLILGYLTDNFYEKLNLNIFLVPRVLLFHCCMCFILGLVFIESIVVRLDTNNNIIVGPIGTFLASWISLYFIELIVLQTNEIPILIPLCYSCVYTYGNAKAINHTSSPIGSYFITLIIFLATIIVLIPSPYIDDVAIKILKSNVKDSKLDISLSYLMGKGGLFNIPMFVPIFVTMSSFLLLHFQEN